MYVNAMKHSNRCRSTDAVSTDAASRVGGSLLLRRPTSFESAKEIAACPVSPRLLLSSRWKLSQSFFESLRVTIQYNNNVL